MNKAEIYALLDAKSLLYEVTEHKAVFNMADMSEIEIPYPDADAKNLFVRDDKHQRYFLITVLGDARVDLKMFRKTFCTRPLSFASAEEMRDILNLSPGSVTPFGLLNDAECKVEFFIDSRLVGDGKRIGCHPNDNTATVWLFTRDLLTIIAEHGNKITEFHHEN